MNKPFSTLRRGRNLMLMVSAIASLYSCKKDSTVEPDKEAAIRPVTEQSKTYVTQLFEYQPAPGQYINTDLASETAARSVLLSNSGLVSLGGFGGYVVFGFDHTVLNRDSQDDLVIYGNAFNAFAEPGVIWVMQDTNGNGKPDDTWYELAGSETGKPGYVNNYSVTYTRPNPLTGDVPWKDSQGKSGVVKTNAFHTQAYYPESLTANTYTLSGTLLPSSNIDDSNPSYITSAAFPFGYADNTPGGDKADIARAVDASGKPVSLKGIDFVKIQTGIQYNMGWLGECSTEVSGIADLSLLKN
ncbi:cell surface protein [Mucilaginibacter sp. Bleaf8]|uniref:cell surface protein n=1 Tax=Mucilaginibacter sp. Bleaf8 TaxID=2834430 RepID=UPI001BCC3482|nr:cell surface protein [Mucilaginibacter sp. Bleaf8]MBS7562821.1 cell surface protein [Mucilaginibacter sp. Bleaf8]